jgi:hypothetical protein
VLSERLKALAGLRPLRNVAAESEPGYYKVGFQFHAGEFGGLSRDRFVEAARAEGIALDAGFRSLHVGRSRTRYRAVEELAEAERAHHGMVVLHHPVLLGIPKDIEEIATAMRKLFDHRHELAATLGT